MRRALRQLLAGTTTLLLLGCGETEVKVSFQSFACSPPLPSTAQFLFTQIGAREVEGGRESLDPLGAAECIAYGKELSAPALAAFFDDRDYIVKGVPTDRGTRLAIFPVAACSAGATVQVCLLSDPIQTGGHQQEVMVRGICSSDADWQICSDLKP